jgi:hypothetical protein
MKHFYALVLVSFLFFNAKSQILTGGLHANFGVDADTKAGYKKYGPSIAFGTSDDWFASAGANGNGVIDTSNASYYKTQLQNYKNISFSQGMSKPEYSNVNGKLWLDAVYVRDYAKGKDSTSFLSGRNGDNPGSWNGGITTLAADNDIVDAFAHLRRDGSSANDSLWLFASISTVGNSINRYADLELFNKNISYNRNTGKFNSAGALSGHTQWLFDARGNVIQTGDVLITIVYQAGQKPKVDVHIWVAKLFTSFITPSLFKFGTVFHSTNGVYGYANIIPKAATIITGSAIMNASFNSNTDTTSAAPWGTMKPTGSWSQTYQSMQMAEIGLNLTRIGIDPSSYLATSLQNCSSFYQSVLFKSGAYSSGYYGGEYDNWYGNYGRGNDDHDGDHEDDHGGGCSDYNEYVGLEDFAGPFNFTTPVFNYTVSADTLTCDRPIGTLSVTNQLTGGVYNWSTLNGNIVESSPDGSVIKVKQSGLYMVTGRLANGCPALITRTVVVPVDSLPPVATTDLGMTPSGDIQLIGGDPLASNVMTRFGCSNGLKWEWKGPNNFSSSEQSPLINMDWAWGAYYLTVEEKRNGCKASAAMDVSFRASHGQKDGLSLDNASASTGTYFSRVADKVYLVTNQQTGAPGTVAIYGTNGALLGTRKLQLNKGQNTIELTGMKNNEIKIVSLYVGKQLVFTRKVF